jgi:probable phosphoglycerate mutase
VEGIDPPHFRGRTELPLTVTGVRQAERTRDYFSGMWRPAALYASPLGRCVHTATIIGAPHGLVPQVLNDFVDIDYGRWQGRSFADVQQHAPDAFARWHSAPQLVQVPDGESLLQVANRVAGAMRLLAERHATETVILVGHNTVNRVLLLLALDLPLGRYWHIAQEPCAFNLLEHDGRGTWSVRSINETAHLASVSA